MPARRRADGAVDTPLGVLGLPAAPPWAEGTLAIRPERVRIAAADGPSAAGPGSAASRRWSGRRCSAATTSICC